LARHADERLEGSFAQVDVVFEIGFEGTEHLGPAHAVAVGAIEAALGFAPAGFGDADELSEYGSGAGDL
jgi:hypothetical protein